MWTIRCSKLIQMNNSDTLLHGHTKINTEDLNILALNARLLHSGSRKLCRKVPRRAWIQKNQAKYFVSLHYHIWKLSFVAVLHFENMLPLTTVQTWQTFLKSVSSCVLVDCTAVVFFEPWCEQSQSPSCYVTGWSFCWTLRLNLPGFFSVSCFYRLCPFDAGLVRLWLCIQRCCTQKEQICLCLIPFKSARPQSPKVIVLRYCRWK